MAQSESPERPTSSTVKSSNQGDEENESRLKASEVDYLKNNGRRGRGPIRECGERLCRNFWGRNGEGGAKTIREHDRLWHEIGAVC